MKRLLVAIFFLGFFVIPAQATHNRAGEITYEQLSQFVYRATIITYTKTSSPADRPELELFWGDGSSSVISRTSFQDNFGGPGSDIRRNIYTGVHTYPGPSVYTMYFEDPNRNGGVINIPNSINVPFYIESQLIISAFLGFNNSPILLQPPIDDGVVGQPFIHNANAFDPDGDSLSYQLTSCKGAGGASIPGYSYPLASNFFRLDSVTGDLEWDSPVACGEYNIAFLIKEWRHGVQIGFVERDMQVNIVCNNPNTNILPQVTSLNDTCVVAGSLLSFNVSASDPNSGNTIVLTATGGPLEVSFSPAQFPQPVSGTGFVSQQFNWQTDCAHVRLQPYQMVFKAEDNDPFINLVDMQSMRIRVVAPGPLNPLATPVGNNIQLTWNQSLCSEASGYSIYRRVGFYGYVPGPCETGVPAYTGYARIASVTGLTSTSFLDDNSGVGLAPGTDYCYMIVAEFPDGSESIASAEACAVLKKESPVLTNVSITATSSSAGSVYLSWSRPSDLDTIQYPGPFEYHILRAPSFNGGTYVLAGINTGGLNDTIFNDASLNTIADAWHYKVVLYATVNGSLAEAGTSHTASSVFLTAVPTDEKVVLSWQEDVTWSNASFTIYRFNGVAFDSIGFSLTHTFTDSLLLNGQTYCYKIRSTGSYASPGYIDPIINFSEEICAIPLDNVPPCAPAITSIQYDCPGKTITFHWEPLTVGCDNDIEYFSVYYASESGGQYQLLQQINDPNISDWIFSDSISVAGCYYVTAADSVGNVSETSTQLCFEYCPRYELPNVFTPDGNNLNDLFMPFPYQYVDAVELKIYNRWGQLVFTTDNPAVLWNGKKDNTGAELPSGVYYYIGQVRERFLSGIESRELKGTIQLIR